jgi:hypothetical protein
MCCVHLNTAEMACFSYLHGSSWYEGHLKGNIPGHKGVRFKECLFLHILCLKFIALTYFMSRKYRNGK